MRRYRFLKDVIGFQKSGEEALFKKHLQEYSLGACRKSFEAKKINRAFPEKILFLRLSYEV